MKHPFIVAVAALMMASCAPDDRCGDDLELAGAVCVIPDTDTDTDTNPLPDGGDTDQDSGLGEPCTSGGDECADFDADFCLTQPGADEGYCSFENCAGNESICTGTFECCNMGSTSFCASESDYSVMAGLGLCQE